MVIELLAFLRRHNHALPVLAAFAGLLLTMFVWRFSPTLSIIVAAGALYAVYMEVMTQWAFRAPMARKPKLIEEEWNPLAYDVAGIQMFTNHAVGEQGRPTVWICHGWTSGSQRMVGRAESFRAKGWNVVMVDLPSHGGSQRLRKWTAEESTTLVIGSINRLAEEFPSLFAGPVYYYGHSMGAFIGLRISKRRDEVAFGENLAGWVFESPMTGYTEIFEETCRLLRVPRFLRPVLLRKTIRHVNAINQRPQPLYQLLEADMPLWGMPREPLLLVQAQPDERLGNAHHQRLETTMQEAGVEHLLSAYYLKSLRHSGAAVHDERDRLVSQWIDVHSSSE